MAPPRPRPGRLGRPREIRFRAVIKTLRFPVRPGCGWRMLQVHSGPRARFSWSI